MQNVTICKANESPAASMDAVRAQENRQNMTNNMSGGWIPMGSNAYNIDQVNEVVDQNQNPHNASVRRRRLRRRERRALRLANAHGNNHGPYHHGYSQHRVTVKGLGGGGGAKRTARFAMSTSLPDSFQVMRCDRASFDLQSQKTVDIVPFEQEDLKAKPPLTGSEEFSSEAARARSLPLQLLMLMTS
jgi:hypothetical protein